MDGGHIKIYRKFFKHFLWNEKRVFSKAEAWIDLIRLARYKQKSEVFGSHVIEVQKGELVASRRFLEEKWSWGSTKVTNFLRMLEEQKMIEVKTNHPTNQSANLFITVIKLSNYDHYNGEEDEMEPTDKPPLKPETNHGQTTDKPRTNQIEESNKESIIKKKNKEEREKELLAARAATLEREKQFYDSLVPFTEKYGKDMIRRFFNYWSEKDQSQTKMRFEREKTWETPKRLVAWESKGERFEPKRSAKDQPKTNPRERNYDEEF